MSRRSTPYVLVEGLDGTGKTTQATRLAERYEAAGLTVDLIREPVRPWRDLAIDTLLNQEHPTVQLLAMLTSRAAWQLSEESAQTDLVIADRGFLSTLVYQGPALAKASGKSLDKTWKEIMDLHQMFGLVHPGLTVVLLSDWQVAAARAKARGEMLDEARLKTLAQDYAEALGWVMVNYRNLRVETLDVTDLSPDEVVKRLETLIRAHEVLSWVA